MTLHSKVNVIATSMEEKRRELIAKPLARIWKDLAEVAVEKIEPVNINELASLIWGVVRPDFSWDLLTENEKKEFVEEVEMIIALLQIKCERIKSNAGNQT